MKVKVFEANDMATALRLVKESLGPEALILSTRTVRKSGFGMLGKPTIEVTAAIDSPDSGQGAPAGPDPAPNENWRKRKVIEPLEEEVQGLKGLLANLDVEGLRQEINELKELMKNHGSSGSAGHPDKTTAGSQLVRMIAELTSLGVEPATAEKVGQRAIAQQPAAQGEEDRPDLLTRVIADSVCCSGPFFGPSSKKPRRIALIGPTGVGKTTTVAKLAADYLINHGRSLALATIDIYRIAAAEQLKVYGEIMNVPVDVAGSPRELRQVLQKYRDKDLVLIDTAGHSPRDRARIKELHAFIGPESGIENHLVLSAATGEGENHTAVRRFTGVPLKSLILTKLDECETLGPLLNIHLRHGTPLSYLTDGQRVPEDLLLAEPGQVGRLVIDGLVKASPNAPAAVE